MCAARERGCVRASAGGVSDTLGHGARVTLAGQTAWHGGPDSDGIYGTVAAVGTIDLEVYGDSTAETDKIMTAILQTLLGRGNKTAAKNNGYARSARAGPGRASHLWLPAPLNLADAQSSARQVTGAQWSDWEARAAAE